MGKSCQKSSNNKRPSKTKQLKSSTTKRKSKQQEKREAMNHNQRSQGESQQASINYQGYSLFDIFEESQAFHNNQNHSILRQYDAPSRSQILNLDPSDPSDPSDGESSSSQLQISRSPPIREINRRNRPSLPPQQRRRFINMTKYLFGALKRSGQLYKYDGLQQIVDNSVIIMRVYDALLVVLRRLSSRKPNKSDLMMLFNKWDPFTNQRIRKLTRKNKAQMAYQQIIDRYDQQVINKAKSQLRSNIERSLTRERISQEAEDRGFSGPLQQDRRQYFQKYFLYFKQELQSGHIKPIIRTKRVLNQVLYKN